MDVHAEVTGAKKVLRMPLVGPILRSSGLEYLPWGPKEVFLAMTPETGYLHSCTNRFT